MKFCLSYSCCLEGIRDIFGRIECACSVNRKRERESWECWDRESERDGKQTHVLSGAKSAATSSVRLGVLWCVYFFYALTMICGDMGISEKVSLIFLMIAIMTLTDSWINGEMRLNAMKWWHRHQTFRDFSVTIATAYSTCVSDFKTTPSLIPMFMFCRARHVLCQLYTYMIFSSSSCLMSLLL